MTTVLYNQSGLARLWGVSRERIGQMRAEHDDFPPPDYVLSGPASMQPLWREETVMPWRNRQLSKTWR